MFKNISQAYFLISSFVYIMLCFVFLGYFANAYTKYSAPELNAYPPASSFLYLQTNADFVAEFRLKLGENSPFFQEVVKKSYDEITRMREAELKRRTEELRKEDIYIIKMHAKRDMIFNGQWCILSLFILILHLIIYKKVRPKDTRVQKNI